MGGKAAVRAALAALLLAACMACTTSSAEKAGPTATVATEVPTTATTNPYAVPPVIDAAYINRVLAGLDAAVGHVTRMVIRTGTIPREAYDRLRSIYGNDDGLQLAIDTYQSDIRRNFSGYKSEPGNEITNVTKVFTAKPTCVFAQVVRDYTAVGVKARAADVQWVAIRPAEAARDPNHYNPMSWAFAYEGFPPDRSQPPDPCAG